VPGFDAVSRPTTDVSASAPAAGVRHSADAHLLLIEIPVPFPLVRDLHSVVCPLLLDDLPSARIHVARRFLLLVRQVRLEAIDHRVRSEFSRASGCCRASISDLSS
jgi:hypothetical protein